LNEIDINKLRMDRTTPIYGAPPRRRRPWGWILILAAAAGAAGVYFFYPFPVPVQTTQVVNAWPSERYVVLNSTGYVVARTRAAVASKGTGRVEWLGVSEGDSIKQGTVVARLESRDVRATHKGAVANVGVAKAAVTTARTELKAAERDHKRVAQLNAKGLVTEANLDDATTRVERAQAAVESATAGLDAAVANEEFAGSAVDYTEIRAPFDGVVLSLNVNVGDIVTPLSSAADARGAVLTMADMATLEVDADVSESSLSLIHVGQPCEIVLDAFPHKRFQGEVSIIVPSVNRSSATVTTKVRFVNPDSSIMPDMSARVGFLSQKVNVTDQEPVVAVNPQAIVERNGNSVVFMVGPDSRAQSVPVAAGEQLGSVQALEGDVQVGDSLILNPGKLQDGDRVELPERP
jgi:RND family efflux transporter MFP subunit